MHPNDTENCLNCMHCVLRFGNFVCNEPGNKRSRPNALARIVNGNGHCAMWDTLDESFDLDESNEIGVAH